MIELTPYTAQSVKRYENHEGPVTESLLSPEETVSAFAAESGPGCRVSMITAVVIAVMFLLLFTAGGFAVYTDSGGLLTGAICGFFVLLALLLGFGIWRSIQRTNAWKKAVAKVMDFPVVSAPSVTNPVGGALPVRFEQHVKVPVTVDTVQLQLVMTESATYTSGTDTYTDTRDIVQDEDWHSGLSGEIGETIQQAFTLKIPNSPHTLHSWSGGNNKIIWRVRLNVTYVEGTTPESLNMDYLLDVLPRVADEA